MTQKYDPNTAVSRDKPLWEEWVSPWILAGFRGGQYQGDAIGDKLTRREDNNLGTS